jgi:hypothetical protein
MLRDLRRDNPHGEYVFLSEHGAPFSAALAHGRPGAICRRTMPWPCFDRHGHRPTAPTRSTLHHPPAVRAADGRSEKAYGQRGGRARFEALRRDTIKAIEENAESGSARKAIEREPGMRV